MTEQQYLSSEATDDAGQPNTDVWRKEIHSRVVRYRTRRGRRIEGAFSMRFPFPPTGLVAASPAAAVQPASPEQNMLVVEAANATEPVSIAVASADLERTESVAVTAEASAEVALSEPQAASQPRTRPKRKVIAFPRQVGGSEAVQRLADPVLPDQPRILDVPEELEAFPTTPFLEGLQFETTQQIPAVPSEHIELPFRAVSISQRIYAALVDCSLVAVATAGFALIGHKMLPSLAFTKPVLLTAAPVPALLWAIYQYLLL